MLPNEADVVFVKGLSVEAVIGVFDWERAITQPIMIDITLETDISKAALSDDVKDALSYKDVCDDVAEWCKELKAKLLEHLAEQLAEKLLAKYNCQKLTLSDLKCPFRVDLVSFRSHITQSSNQGGVHLIV